MHGPGERDQDADIEALLLGKEPEDVIYGLQIVDKRYRYRMVRYLEARFPGLSSPERARIWEGSLDGLMDLIQKGKFEAKGSVTGLLRDIIHCDAVDCLRRKKRWKRFVRRAGQTTDTIIRFDDRHNLADLLAAINQYTDTMLDILEQVVLRTYVRLLCEGHATATGRLSLPLLTREVNDSIHPQRLSQTTVQSLHRKGREKLRTFLEQKGFFQ